MDLVRKFLQKVFSIPLVILVDRNGDTKLRIKRRNHIGKWFAEYYDRVYSRKVTLNRDGSVSGLSYVERWYDYPYNPNQHHR